MKTFVFSSSHFSSLTVTGVSVSKGSWGVCAQRWSPQLAGRGHTGDAVSGVTELKQGPCALLELHSLP